MTIRFHDLPRRLGRAAIATVLAAAGCGPAVENGESQVWGRVTARGKPLTQGTVVFMPLAERDVTWGAGHLDGQGRFHLSASRSDVPLLPGRYSVYIKAPTRVDPAEARLVPIDGYPVPAKYLDANAPIIQVEIKDEPTRFDFNLDD